MGAARRVSVCSIVLLGTSTASDVPASTPGVDAIAQLAVRGILKGYGDGTFGPTDRVLHIQVISFITRGMVQAGYWQAVTVDDPTPYPNVPLASGHRLDLLTYTKYAGALPDRALGQALNSFFSSNRVP